MKVWVVDTGAYENNYIDCIFSNELQAEAYVNEKNEEAEKLAAIRGGRSFGDKWIMTEYELFETKEAFCDRERVLYGR
jgi:hypothetical protein